jgi:hypothetical protein
VLACAIFCTSACKLYGGSMVDSVVMHRVVRMIQCIRNGCSRMLFDL